MVAAGEGLDEAGGVLMSLHRERGQLQAGDPAFGAGFQGRDVFGREVEAHDLVEEIGSFGGGETQVGRTQLGHLPPAAQAGQWELRVLTGGDDQVHLGRLVFKQKGQNCGDRCRCVNRSLCIDRSGIDQVVVVKDEDELPARGRDLVQERGQECFGARRLGGLERSQHLCSDAGEEGLQRRDEVGQKARGRAVRCVQRKPGDANPSFARLATGEPFADQRGLAEAGGGRDEGQFVAGRETLVQPLDQPGARDHLGSRWGDIEFRRQDRRGHGSIIQRPPRLRKVSRRLYHFLYNFLSSPLEPIFPYDRNRTCTQEDSDVHPKTWTLAIWHPAPEGTSCGAVRCRRPARGNERIAHFRGQPEIRFVRRRRP